MMMTHTNAVCEELVAGGDCSKLLACLMVVMKLDEERE